MLRAQSFNERFKLTVLIICCGKILCLFIYLIFRHIEERVFKNFIEASWSDTQVIAEELGKQVN